MLVCEVTLQDLNFLETWNLLVLLITGTNDALVAILVGYNFEFEYEDGVFYFKFVDTASDEELNLIAAVINRAIPWIDGFYYVRPGVIAATLAYDITDIVFRTGVRAIESMIYETIY